MKRRTHQKSRNGCTICKKNRIKCDEQKPACQRCLNRSIDCHYPVRSRTPTLRWVDSGTPGYPEDHPASRDRPDAVDSRHAPNQPPTSSRNLEDEVEDLTNAKLMVNWFTRTVFTVNPPNDDQALNVSQTLVLGEAMRHDYLMHGLLALSALHLAERAPEPGVYLEVAMLHHNKGLSLHRSRFISTQRGSNQTAAVAFAGLTVIFTLALLRPHANKGDTSPLENIVQVCKLAKGWHVVVQDVDLQAGESYSSDSVMISIRQTYAIHWHGLRRQMEKLRDLAQRNHCRICLDAIDELEQAFLKSADDGRQNPHIAVDLAHHFSSDFLNLLVSGDKLSLVVIAYYAVILDCFSGVWWLRGWGKEIFTYLDAQQLGGEYRRLLDWPRHMIMDKDFKIL